MKKVYLAQLCLFFLLVAGPVPAEDQSATIPFSFTACPSMSLPLGPGADLFALGAGGRLAVAYSPPSSRAASLGLGLLYDYHKLQADAGSTSEFALLANAAWSIPLAPKLSFSAGIGAGYSFGFMNGDSLTEGGGSPVAEAGVGLAFAFNQNLGLRLDVSYLYFVGVHGGLAASFGLSVTPPRPKATTIILTPTPRRVDLEVTEIELLSVFPIFRTWYDQNPVGRAVVRNTGNELITNASLSFLIKQYMDGPKECASIAELKPGETREIPLFALFNSSILDITEPTKATSQVDVAYTEAGEKQDCTKTATIRIYDRNAMTWDDDQKAAAFVSGKDPWVLDLSTNISAMVQDFTNPSVCRNLQLAIAYHNALRLYGLSYTPNPKTPYSETSKNPEIVDFLRFPRQTLAGKSGDCSDLSILYASLFESVGVETAFITVPGHIFMAIDLDMSAEEARMEIINYSDLVIRDGEAWMPIETTIRDLGLLNAWKEGAGEWRQCEADGTAAFFPIREAWRIYEPVGLAADDSKVRVPPADLVTQVFASELAKYVEQDLSARVSAVNDTMRKSGETAKGLNNRGVMYAKAGRMDLAEQDFQAAVKRDSAYVPSLVNLGNLARLKADLPGAYALYQQAAKADPKNAKVLINLALTASALGKDEDAAVAYESVKRLDAALAARYSFIAEKGSVGTRAAEASTSAVYWHSE